ncbi:MAG: hypothetical protein WBC04_13985 [Candidatus Acidiferrales bacterium]
MEKYKRLRTMSDEEVVKKIDELASWTQQPRGGNNELDAFVYLNELSRREQDKQTTTIVRCTIWITAMTLAILILTAILVLAVLRLRP